MVIAKSWGCCGQESVETRRLFVAGEDANDGGHARSGDDVIDDGLTGAKFGDDAI